MSNGNYGILMESSDVLTIHAWELGSISTCSGGASKGELKDCLFVHKILLSSLNDPDAASSKFILI
jgi:hypothetical protein